VDPDDQRDRVAGGDVAGHGTELSRLCRWVAAGPFQPRFSAEGVWAYTIDAGGRLNEGCSARLVFTGQTVLCGGSAAARQTQTLVVAD
jgi:hypothetical protein